MNRGRPGAEKEEGEVTNEKEGEETESRKQIGEARLYENVYRRKEMEMGREGRKVKDRAGNGLRETAKKEEG